MNDKNKPQSKGTFTVEHHSIGDLTIKLLTTPINPDAAPDEQVRLTNEEIATQVTRAYPDRKANGAKQCVAWYASKLRDSAYRAKHGGKEALPSRMGEGKRTTTIELPTK